MDPIVHKLDQYPTLFHKYLLGISQNGPISYEVIKDISSEVKVWNCICHFHIFDLDQFNSFRDAAELVGGEMSIVITYCLGSPDIIRNSCANWAVLKIPNRGYDIGAKMCCLDYLGREGYQFEYMLFLHSKTNLTMRKRYFDPFIKSGQRLRLICELLRMKQTNLLGIFPQTIWYDHQGHKNYGEYDVYVSNQKYYEEILSFLDIGNRDKIFAEGNCMILHTSVIQLVFGNNLNLFYQILNQDNSFDWNWFKIYYPQHELKSLHEAYWFYRVAGLIGNNTPVKNSPRSIPDGMVEHVFERIWINVIQELAGKYLILDGENIIDRYQIKLNAIYFPQFHEIPENNKFWGEGFVEWSLLQPFPDMTTVAGIEYQTLKPHTDLGYYDLNTPTTLAKQIKIAESYGINGFVIYHYWFENNHKILYKPLEYFLSPEFTFPFAISWANEPWSRRWDGSNTELLIAQSYGTPSDYRTHINYLIPFFERPNYMRTVAGECIFYIYHFAHLRPFYGGMMEIWQAELAKRHLRIKIIITENATKENHTVRCEGVSKFLFEPMYSTHYLPATKTDYGAMVKSGLITFQNFDFEFYINTHSDIKSIYGTNYNYIFEHFIRNGATEHRRFRLKNSESDSMLSVNYMAYSYEQIIAQYTNQQYECDDKHLGLPLYWNNNIRRQNMLFLMIKDFGSANFERMIYVLLGTILLRHTGGIGVVVPRDNIININAWNEWNEQAVLEPNSVTGYENLEIIKYICANV